MARTRSGRKRLQPGFVQELRLFKRSETGSWELVRRIAKEEGERMVEASLAVRRQTAQGELTGYSLCEDFNKSTR